MVAIENFPSPHFEMVRNTIDRKPNMKTQTNLTETFIRLRACYLVHKGEFSEVDFLNLCEFIYLHIYFIYLFIFIIITRWMK